MEDRALGSRQQARLVATATLQDAVNISVLRFDTSLTYDKVDQVRRWWAGNAALPDWLTVWSAVGFNPQQNGQVALTRYSMLGGEVFLGVCLDQPMGNAAKPTSIGCIRRNGLPATIRAETVTLCGTSHQAGRAARGDSTGTRCCRQQCSGDPSRRSRVATIILMRSQAAFVFICATLVGCGAISSGSPTPAPTPMAVPLSLSGTGSVTLPIEVDEGAYQLRWTGSSGVTTGCAGDYSTPFVGVDREDPSTAGAPMPTATAEGEMFFDYGYKHLKAGPHSIHIRMPEGSECPWHLDFAAAGSLPSQEPVSLPATFTGQVAEDYEDRLFQPVVLPGGGYAVEYGPATSSTDCPHGMAVDFTDPSGKVLETGAESRTEGTHGRYLYPSLDPGTYELMVYSSCPWRVSIRSWKEIPRTELPFVLSGPPSQDGKPTTARVHLDVGEYVLGWSADEPFDPSAGSCGVTISLTDESGNEPFDQSGVSTVVTAPKKSATTYFLAYGSYDLFVYVGCPWSVTLTSSGS